MMLTHEEIEEAAEELARGWSLPSRCMGDPYLTRRQRVVSGTRQPAPQAAAR